VTRINRTDVDAPRENDFAVDDQDLAVIRKSLMFAIVYLIRVSRTFMPGPPIRGKTETACDIDYYKKV
jgi:hypothetical protein